MNILEKFKPIKTFIFDMDGVLTDGTLIIQSGTEWLRKMHIRDGHAISHARKKGYRIAILSGSLSKPVKERLLVLGVKDVFMMVSDKKNMLQEYIKKHKLNTEEVLFMGDDIPDVQCLQAVGLSTCPADAATELKQVSKYISPYKGGEGCVRDVIEKVLKLNGHWDDEVQCASA